MNTDDALPDRWVFGRLELVPSERRLRVDGQAVALGSRAYDLLVALAARRERIVPNEELIAAVWPGLVVEDNNLQVQVSALRKVLGAQAIATVPGRGYQFTMAPSESATPLASPALPDAGREGRAGRLARLLVVDDNKVNRLMLARTLELLGHEVVSVDNGRSALAALRSDRFDLMLLDIQMPEMDGFDLLERRAGEPAMREVPVIVTSALEGVADVARCIELGADDFLHKPVNPVLLRARVDSSLERKFLRDRQRELLARLGPGVSGGLELNPGGRSVEATALVARLSWADAAPASAADTLELLGRWTTLMLDAVEGHGGQAHQLGGDGVTAAFESTGAARQAADEMTELVAQFNAERIALRRPPVGMGLGLASGVVVIGDAGTARRSSHVCVGPAVATAARLAAAALEQGRALLIDSAPQAAPAGPDPRVR
jgi:DNA-binding response OmpR family regulator